MNLPVQVDQKQLMDVLLNVATVRPVFIWGAPGIGKSAIVQQFAADVGLECVSLLGSQLAPEDIIGVPQIVKGRSVFCPPRSIAREEPYCLFLDELNACSHEVQKAFYSLILERRIGEYHLPDGSIVIGAGNRAQDNAITRPMSSALVNRMFHVELTANSRVWLEWAAQNGIHRFVYDYICSRPDHLWAQPPKTEEPFSTPRSWEMLSDILHSYGEDISENTLSLCAYGLPHCRSRHAIYSLCPASPQQVLLEENSGWDAEVARQARGTGCAVFSRSELSQSADQGTAGIPQQAERRKYGIGVPGERAVDRIGGDQLGNRPNDDHTGGRDRPAKLVCCGGR